MDKRSSVLAVIMGGYGFGGMIIMPVIGRLIAAYGYQVAYRAHSAAGLILLLVTIIFIRDTPEQMGVKPYGWEKAQQIQAELCLLYTSPSPRDPKTSRMPSSA